jgi:hypothetical protein
MPCSRNQRSARIRKWAAVRSFSPRSYLRIHQPAAVVDGDVEHVPAGTALLAAVIAMDAMPRAAHTSPRGSWRRSAPSRLGWGVRSGSPPAVQLAGVAALGAELPDAPWLKGRRRARPSGSAFSRFVGLARRGRCLLCERQPLRRTP